MHPTGMPLYRALLDYSHIHERGAAFKLDDRKLARYLTQALPEAVPFDFTDVMTALENELAHSPAQDMYEWIANLPPCVPPYPKMLVEGGFPELPGAAVASLLFTEQLPDKRFAVVAYGYGLDSKGKPFGPVSTTQILLDAYGSPEAIQDEHGKAARMRVQGLAPYAPTEDGDAISKAMALGLFTTGAALFGCALLNCKNVTERHQNLPRQQARDRARRQLPAVVWKTLVVEPTPTARTQAEVSDVLDARKEKRLHLVRGHFRTYGEEGRGLLFGRYAGRYWIPSQVKGSLSSGLIVKDYKVKTDQSKQPSATASTKETK